MINSQEPHQPNSNTNPPKNAHQRNPGFIPDKQYIFSFLQKGEKSSSSSFPPFFSENGLSQDIIKVTNAEPDICLEVFYALYNTLWPQIENDSDISIKDAWAYFVGGTSIKGSLCPPEKLITEKRVRDIKNSLSTKEGEKKIFQYLDQVMDSISHLKQKIVNYRGQILQKKDIIASLRLIQDFYFEFRNKVKVLVQVILDKEQINASYASESDALEDLLEPKAIMMSDIFPHHWAYRISRNQAQKLLSLDRYGHRLQKDLSGPSNHYVVALPEKVPEPLVFFKANGNPPIQPEKEFMIYSLYQHLQIPLPETALLILTDVLETSPSNFYAVQASEAVLGESPLIANQNKETVFDHEAYVSQTIGAFLTNPSDGFFKNFQYSRKYKHFISIDNDEIFEPELAGKADRRFVKVKSVLYLLPQIDLPIPQSTKTFFSTFDPNLTILAWLKGLSQKNQDYQLLFTRLAFQKTRGLYQDLSPSSTAISLATSLQQKVLVDHEADDEPFYPRILVSQSVLKSLTEKLQILEKTLITKSSVSTQSLFEEISPVLGKYYRKLRFEFDNPEEAEEVLKGNKKNSVDYSYISSILDSEELSNLSSNQTGLDESQVPEIFVSEYKETLISGQNALDQFIGRHSLRINKNVMNLQGALKELKFLIQERLTDSKSMRDIVDFCSSLSKMVENNPDLIKEITSLLANLPYAELKWLFTLEEYFLRPDSSLPKDLEASCPTVIGALLKERRFILTESENQYLFDQQGDIKRNPSLTGRSCVTYFPEKESQFYLKQYPEWPGYEFASTLFMRLLGLQHLPYHDLLIVNSRYPVLLTQTVHGDPILRIWHNSQVFQNLDPVHTGLLIISAMLLNPEDGKEDNFILSPDGKYLIPIDNDHCFLPSTLQKEGTFWNAFTVNIALQTKTILFCLDEMSMPIPLEVRQRIQSIDFDGLLSKWITEVDKIDNKLNNLVDQDQRNKFLEQGTVMRIPFYKQFIENIHWKAHKIQKIFKAVSEITPFDLLKAVEPFAAKCYQDSFKQGSNLQSRFKAATGQLYKKTAIDGSRVSILNTRTMMEIINVSEKDLRNDVRFQRMGPIDALELLNQLVQESAQKATMEQEMLYELNDKNQEKKWVNLFGKSSGETALKAFFTNPKEGLIIKGSKLVTSSKLIELFAQATRTGTKIRFLSLPESPSLSDKEIRILAEECPNLEYLNVSGCIKLMQLITREGEWPLLARLEAKGCSNLEKLVSSSPIKIFRVETYQKIEIFVEKSTLEIFTISQRKEKFSFSLKQGENLKIKSHGEILPNSHFFLQALRGENEIENYFQYFSINIKLNLHLLRKNIGAFLTVINFRNFNIKNDEIRIIAQLNLLNLKNLDLSQNEMMETKDLEYLIQGNWPKLNRLDISSNKINSKGIQILVQGNWPLLEVLNISKTDVAAEGVEILVEQHRWPRLKNLNLSGNAINEKGLQILSRGNWPLLELLNVSDAEITQKKSFHSFFNTKWSNLEEADFHLTRENAPKNLLQKNWHLLEQEDQIEKNEIEVLIINQWNWPQLKHLDISLNGFYDEGLQTVTFAKWLLLESLNLSSTKITAQGLEKTIKNFKWPNLKSLNVSLNPIQDEGLEILVLENWPFFEHLSIRNTSITTQGICFLAHRSNWPHLKEVDVSHNPVLNEGLEGLVSANWNLLEHLNLEDTGITNEGIQILVKKSRWPNLKRLHVSGNHIGDEGLETLSYGKWPLLEALYLRNINITSRGVYRMTSISQWSNLKILDFSSNLIFKDYSFNFREAEWPLLESLNLNNTDVSPSFVRTVIEKSYWPRLKEVHVQGCNSSNISTMKNLISRHKSRIELIC